MPTTRSHRRLPERIHPAPPGSMHRCLYILEILRGISYSMDSVTDSTTLLHMGLACRAFFDPAMDALWRTILNPCYLFWPLQDSAAVLRMHLKLVREPTAAQWQRFNEYARRVQVLEDSSIADNPHDFRSLRIHWPSLLKYFSGNQILPNLGSFTIGFYCFLNAQEAVPDCTSLFPKLPFRILKLTPWETPDMRPALSALPASSETLEELEITPVNPGLEPDDTLDKLSAAISMSRLPDLTTLVAPLLYPCALRHLATLPNLRKLSFGIDTAVPQASPLLFRTLKTLCLKTDIADPSPPTTFLRQIVAPALQDLSFIYDIYDYPFGNPVSGPRQVEYMRQLLQAVSTLRSLRSFELECWSDPLYDADNLAHITDLLPLLPLGDLESLDLRNLPFELAAHDLEPMARAWPSMKCLRLGDSSRKMGRGRRRNSIGDLLSVSRLFPNLTTLGLPVKIPGASTCPPIDLSTCEPQPKLTQLFVHAVDDDYSADAVRALAMVFPNAKVKLHLSWDRDPRHALLRTLNKRKAQFVKELAAGSSISGDKAGS